MLSLGFSILLSLAASTAPSFVAARNVANVLIYSATAGFRHDSIPTAIEEMTLRGPDHGINFDNTEDTNKFTDDYLSQFDAVFFLSNTEEVLNARGKVALQKYLDNGGNFVAAHAATNCMQNWTTMERTLGSYFQYHPAFQNATMVVLDPNNPSTSGLPARWNVTDEVYNFTTDPRNLGAVVVLAVDEDSYVDGSKGSSAQGDPHPIAWYQEHLKGTNSSKAGRSWYTGLGHSNSSWKDDTFMGHIFGGIEFAILSNTTRAMNPDGTVGSLGPVWTPP
ncbi:hypothetical protein M408DRAFT_311224 [Serendipita vermifera MAFF 305830]|uniref:ThuA-like domain-containing protein n=1 Tax=Serendipita vermifera MAFF 305830 TaxID=933852 RepID=A0A0C3AS13_SERVB|nr:hypothetical protein M408DRAFT_311224 [Serendipita vermifera MAFF 305830]